MLVLTTSRALAHDLTQVMMQTRSEVLETCLQQPSDPLCEGVSGDDGKSHPCEGRQNPIRTNQHFDLLRNPALSDDCENL